MKTNMACYSYPDLAGKVAFVSGGSRGIGAGICRALAKQGVKVAVNGRNQGTVQATVDEIFREGGTAIGVKADCASSSEELEQARMKVERELGPVDIAIANAGGGGNPILLAQMSDEHWRRVVDLNLSSVFFTLRVFVPGMMERGLGAVVAIGSTAGRHPSPASPAYGAAKAGIVQLVRQVATEAAKSKVRVNCVCPGAVLTEGGGLWQASEEMRQRVAAMNPLGRTGTIEDLAASVLFLCSESASWITGVTLDVCGGTVMV
jgi:3-oxoacyl-[acyl-carrier protein] reductase